jgi:hypothetical protein
VSVNNNIPTFLTTKGPGLLVDFFPPKRCLAARYLTPYFSRVPLPTLLPTLLSLLPIYARFTPGLPHFFVDCITDPWLLTMQLPMRPIK